MALRGVIEIGIRDVVTRGRDELAAIVAERGLTPEAAEHVAQTLEAVPGWMCAIDRALREPAVPHHARSLWIEIVAYLLLDEDLVPARAGAPVRGVLDDSYFLHRGALALRAHLPPSDLRSLDGGAELLASILPPDVRAEIDRRIAPFDRDRDLA